MSDARCALILDDAAASLADVALRLLRLRIDVFYAKERDEGWLLAQQEAARIRALLFPPTIDFDEVSAVSGCLRAHAPEVPQTAVVIGKRPNEAVRERLRAGGVEWAIWEPYDDSCLRSVVSRAMTACHDDHSETRAHRRIPTTLPASAYAGTRRKDVVVSTLSPGGAFLETPSPLPEGLRVTLEIALPGHLVTVKADVVYARYPGDDEPGQPSGMGVSFSNLDPANEKRMRRFLDDLDDRFVV